MSRRRNRDDDDDDDEEANREERDDDGNRTPEPSASPSNFSFFDEESRARPSKSKPRGEDTRMQAPPPPRPRPVVGPPPPNQAAVAGPASPPPQQNTSAPRPITLPQQMQREMDRNRRVREAQQRLASGSAPRRSSDLAQEWRRAVAEAARDEWIERRAQEQKSRQPSRAWTDQQIEDLVAELIGPDTNRAMNETRMLQERANLPGQMRNATPVRMNPPREPTPPVQQREGTPLQFDDVSRAASPDVIDLRRQRELAQAALEQEEEITNINRQVIRDTNLQRQLPRQQPVQQQPPPPPYQQHHQQQRRLRTPSPPPRTQYVAPVVLPAIQQLQHPYPFTLGIDDDSEESSRQEEQTFDQFTFGADPQEEQRVDPPPMNVIAFEQPRNQGIHQQTIYYSEPPALLRETNRADRPPARRQPLAPQPMVPSLPVRPVVPRASPRVAESSRAPAQSQPRRALAPLPVAVRPPRAPLPPPPRTQHQPSQIEISEALIDSLMAQETLDQMERDTIARHQRKIEAIRQNQQDVLKHFMEYEQEEYDEEQARRLELEQFIAANIMRGETEDEMWGRLDRQAQDEDMRRQQQEQERMNAMNLMYNNELAMEDLADRAHASRRAPTMMERFMNENRVARVSRSKARVVQPQAPVRAPPQRAPPRVNPDRFEQGLGLEVERLFGWLSQDREPSAPPPPGRKPRKRAVFGHGRVEPRGEIKTTTTGAYRTAKCWVFTLRLTEDIQMNGQPFPNTITLLPNNALTDPSYVISPIAQLNMINGNNNHNIDFVSYQLEFGDCGYLQPNYHYQGYVEFSGKVSALQVVQMMGWSTWMMDDIWLAPRKGTQEAAIAYTVKEPTCVWTFAGAMRADGYPVDPNEPIVPSVRIQEGQRHAQDVVNAAGAIRNMIVAGASFDEIAQEHPGEALRTPNGIMQQITGHRKTQPVGMRRVTVKVRWGKTGTRKTYGVFEEEGLIDVYKKPLKEAWWDGYDDRRHRVILIDEFTNDNDKIKIEDLLQWLDNYPLWLPQRYAGAWANYDTVYITSNLPPHQWFPKASAYHKAALYRRLLTGGITKFYYDTPEDRLLHEQEYRFALENPTRANIEDHKYVEFVEKYF